jgi:phosphatidate phosphatase APP1
MDKRWPTRTFYPGVRKFYEELDRGIDEKSTIGDLVFLTARPHGYKGGIEQLTHDMLGHSKLHTQPVILAGTFSHFFVNKDMAAKKYQNFEMYASVYPEYRFVFIGDSGQGDVAFGKQIKKEFKSRIKLILINGKAISFFKPENLN